MSTETQHARQAVLDAELDALCDPRAKHGVADEHGEHGGGGRLSLADIEDTSAREDLYNAKDYNTPRKKEMPYHRLWIMLRAQGHSCIEIAKRTGYVPQTVREVLNQPWARQKIVEELRQNGRDEVLNIFQSEAADLAWELIDIAKKKDGKDSTRVTAIGMVHDRLLGKAVQPLTHQNLETKDLTDAQLLEKLKEIRATGVGHV